MDAKRGCGAPRTHAPVPLSEVKDRVNTLLGQRRITTVQGTLPLPEGVAEVSICCHSDTPVRASSFCGFPKLGGAGLTHAALQGAVEIANAVKALVDENNTAL